MNCQVINFRRFKMERAYKKDIGFYKELFRQMRNEDLDMRFDIILNELRSGLAKQDLSQLKLLTLCEEYLARDNMPRHDLVEGYYNLCLTNLK